jgi:quinol monooxygenase YgiN/heme-degrading monooxygenase HmoA
MTVTEFAVIPLTHSITKDNPTLPKSLIQKLKTAKAVLESASGHKFYHFQQIEDPSITYFIGQWDSVATHYEFISSEENQKLLELFKDDISSSEDRKMALWHLEANIFAPNASSEEQSVFSAPAISCNRHFVPAEKKQSFASKFQEVRGLLEDYTRPFKVVGGWRIEKELVEGKERDEWVLFSGFENVDHHMGFAKTEEFTKYREIVGFVDGFELTHLTSIEGLS